MHVCRNWRWSALAVAFVFIAPVARAGMITPDSIPNPPSAVASTDGTAISMSNIVNTQYAGLGMRLSAAITSINGVSVWAPITYAASPPWGGAINYASSVGGRFVSPGSLSPTTVSSLTVEILGNPSLSMSVYGLNGQSLNIAPLIRSIAGAENLTFTGPGISSFSAAGVPPSDGAHPATNPSPWGVASVSFTPATTPEPSSLVLAGLGALGMTTRLGWRRRRRIA